MNTAMLLNQNLRDRLHEKKFEPLTPIQEAAIPPILAKNNVLLIAGTSGGKTEAALLPVLTMLAEEEGTSVKVIYVAPLIALLNNLEARIKDYADCVYKNVFKWHGDVPRSQKMAALANPPDILVITPESIEVMFISPYVNMSIFQDLRFVIVDEVHNFAESHRGVHLLALIEKLQSCSIHPIQRIGMSATVDNPQDVLNWLAGSSTLSSKVIQPSLRAKSREWYVAYREDLEEAIPVIEKTVYGKKSIMFVKSRGLAEKASRKFKYMAPFVHHASIDKDLREDIEQQIVTTKSCVISTSTLELGIDIGDLDLIIQYGPPPSVSSLLQRIGRAGRRLGQIPRGYCFCEKPTDLLLTLAMINCAEKGVLSPVSLRSNNYHILFHQILCRILQNSGLTREGIFKIRDRNGSFAGITDSDVEELLTYWLEHDYLRYDGRVFLIGAAADERLCHRNYAELYAVFSSKDEYAVYHNRARIGSLDPGFVLGKAVPFNFTLAGRNWTALDIDHDYKTVLVESTSLSKEPYWGSQVEFDVTYEVAQECRYILWGGELHASINLDDVAQKELEHLRKDVPTKSWAKPGHAFLVTFAGTKINTTLALALGALMNVEARGDFCQVELHRKGTSGAEVLNQAYKVVRKIITSMTPEEFEQLLISLVKEHEYSKFHIFLPDRFNRKFILGEFCDIKGTLEWLVRY
ncbi:MAG: DEAD/DEAH box helicase [Firmicutes bacterium]|nr:DEAD/DEAH box helicase [Bacillota bacterium]